MTTPAFERAGALAPLAVLGGALCLSMSGIMVKLAGLDPMTTAVLRLVIAVVLLIPLALGERAKRGGLSRTGILLSIAAGAALGIDYAAWTAAIFMVGAGVSAVLVNIQVIVLPLIAFFVDGERFTRRFLVTLPVMLIGISLLGGLWNLGDLGDQALLGTVLCLIGGVGYSIYLFVMRRATRREPGLMLQPLMWATLSATIAATVVSPFAGGVHLTGISLPAWAWLLAMASLGYVLAWWLIQSGSVQLPPAVTAALLLTQPVLALILAAIIVAEYPTLLQIFGAVLVILGIAGANGLLRFPWRRGTPAASGSDAEPDQPDVDWSAHVPAPVDTGAIPIIRLDEGESRAGGREDGSGGGDSSAPLSGK